MKLIEPVWPLFEEDVRTDPEYRNLMVAEAGRAMLDGETEVARTLIRTVVRGSIGYDRLAEAAGMPRARVVRALRRSEPATAETVLVLLRAVRKSCGIGLAVSPAPAESDAAAAE